MVLSDAGFPSDGLGVGPFVPFEARETSGKGVPRVITCKLRRETHDRGRIDATAERASDRNVRTQTQTDRVGEQLAKKGGGFVVVEGDFSAPGMPIRLNLDPRLSET